MGDLTCDDLTDQLDYPRSELQDLASKHEIYRPHPEPRRQDNLLRTSSIPIYRSHGLEDTILVHRHLTDATTTIEVFDSDVRVMSFAAINHDSAVADPIAHHLNSEDLGRSGWTWCHWHGGKRIRNLRHFDVRPHPERQSDADGSAHGSFRTISVTILVMLNHVSPGQRWWAVHSTNLSRSHALSQVRRGARTQRPARGPAR